MQIYLDIFSKGQKVRHYVTNATDKLSINFSIDELSNKQLSKLIKLKFAKYSQFSIIINTTPQKLDGLIIDDLAFKLGGYTDKQDLFNNVNFNDFIYTINEFNIKKNKPNKKFYFNMDCKIEKVTIKEQIDNNTFSLKNKDGLFSSSLLFDSKLDLQIFLCLDFNKSNFSSISKKLFYKLLNDIFSPFNMIKNREKLLPLLKITYFSNNNKNLIDVQDYFILFFDVTFRFRNLLTKHNQPNAVLNADLEYIKSFLTNTIQNIYLPVNLSYIDVLSYTNLDIPKWYLSHGINVNNNDFF
jgi:hypothetical protein